MRKLFTKALSGAMALVLAVGLCPAAALASPVTSAELPAAQSVTTQDDPTPTGSYGLSNVELNDGTYTLYGMYSTFGMFKLKKDDLKTRESHPTVTIANESATLTVTVGMTTYNRIALATTNDIVFTHNVTTSKGSSRYGTLPDSMSDMIFNGSPTLDGKGMKFTMKLPKSKLAEAIGSGTGLNFVVGKSTETTGMWYITDTQHYFAFDAFDFGPVKLLPTNEEAMFKAVCASVSSEPASSEATYDNQKYYLTFALNGTSYEKVFPGTFEDCSRLTSSNDDSIVSKSDATVNEEYYYAGSLINKQNQSHYQFKMPISLVDKDGDGLNDTAFTVDFVALASDATYRRAVIDLSAGTVTFGNYQGTSDVSVASSVAKIAPTGSLFVSGYPAIENTAASTDTDKKLLSSKLSNEFSAHLSMIMADKAATYDKMAIDTYNSAQPGTDKVTFEETPVTGDPIAVDATTGAITLPFENHYKISGQVTDGGSTATIKMHVADSANYVEAGKWVPRTVKIDYVNDAVTISGAALTPKTSPQNEAPTTKTSLQGATVQVNDSGLAYDGSAKTPAVTVKVGSTTLRAGTDYTTSYANNVNAGAATVTVTAKSGSAYTGSASAKFTIAKGKQTVTAAKSAYKVSAKKVKKAKKKIAVKFTSTSGGKVTWGKAKTAKGKVSIAKNGKVTVKKGTKKGTYKLKVKVVAAGNDNYEQATVKNVVVVVRVK